MSNSTRPTSSASEADSWAKHSITKDRWEIELSASGVDRFVKTFDYSDQEWAEIESSAQPTRVGPLTEDVRQCLRRAGASYLTLRHPGKEFLKRQQLAFVAKWENVGRLATELYEKLDEAKASSGDDRKYRRLLKSLAKLRDDASILSSKRTSLPLRESYYRDIFRVWVDKLGGGLGVSRDVGTHKLGGPLVRFFQAVTRPVLGTDAPALETISDIVNREKARRAKEHGKERLIKSPQVPARKVESVGISYTDLGPFRTDPDIPFDKQVHHYVVERGLATGLPHMVAVDVDGVVLAHGSGGPHGLLVPGKLTAAWYDSTNRIVIHYSNLFDIGLSEVDISCLAYPGIEAVCRHGDGGNIARGALTPVGREMLRGSGVEEAISRLYRIAAGIGFRIYDVLNDAARSSKISVDQGNKVYRHLIGLYLRDAGILDYRFEATERKRAR